MRRRLLIPLSLALFLSARSQQKEDLSSTMQQQLESMASRTDTEDEEDDSYQQQLRYLARHPLNLNEAGEEDLLQLHMLTDVQVKNFLNYRRLFGALLSIYELQAVPTWTSQVIYKLLPYISVSNSTIFAGKFAERWKAGENSILMRYAEVLEKAKGYNVPATVGASYYQGGRERLFMRYSYNYKNLLQWGILGDKDAGEPFMEGKQAAGFDFYSFHLFVRKAGIIKALALGDFTVNLGQGLIQWQSLAFTKSAEVTGIKRQSEVLRPYNSGGEINFHRGIGLTLKSGRWEATGFISMRKVSGNLDADSSGSHITSLLTSGYYRTQNEIEDRNNVHQFATGGNISYASPTFHLGVNAVHFRFSAPIEKQDRPYNLWALKGKSFTNASIDYSYTYKNTHFFGEAAVDGNAGTAFINGLLFSPDAKVDVSLLHRFISKEYQSLYSDAFTENTSPSNENGMYAGLTLRPTSFISVDAFMDLYKFPWLKYRVDAPSNGRDYFVQLTYRPGKQVEFYARFSNGAKAINFAGAVTNNVDLVSRQDVRAESKVSVSPSVIVKARCELSRYDKNGPSEEQGFLLASDVLYAPVMKPYSGNLRLQYFETDGYNSRIYSFENDVPYSFSIPAFFDKGYRYYLNFDYDLTGKLGFVNKAVHLECWLRWSQTIYPGKLVLSSGLDAIQGNKRSELKLQLMIRH